MTSRWLTLCFVRVLLLVGEYERLGEIISLWKVHEPDGNAVHQAVAYSLPLRRKKGERIIGSLTRFVGPVNEQRNGRPHLLIGEQGQHIRRIGWPFDQDAVGLQSFQGVAQTPSRAGAVMPDAEDVYVLCF